MYDIGKEGVGRLFLVALAVCILLGGIFTVMLLRQSEPLEVVSFSPTDGAEDIDIYSSIIISFNQDINKETLSKAVSFSSPIVGEWNVIGGNATFRVAERMKSNNIYTISLSSNMTSAGGTRYGERFSFSFKTGNTSARTVENGTSVQLDFIGMTEDGLVFATSMQSVHQDNITYPKSDFYVEANKQKLNLLRRFPVVIGKEDEYAVFESEIMDMKIGQTKTITFGNEEPFGPYNHSLKKTILLNETISREEIMSMDDADAAFHNITLGSTAIHPKYGWNITIIHVGSDSVLVRADPSPGGIVQPYGWDTLVKTATASNISIEHMVNHTHLHRIMAFKGVFPQMLFMVMDVNNTAGTVTIDSNWPPGVVGKPTTWIITIYDIKHPAGFCLGTECPVPTVE